MEQVLVSATDRLLSDAYPEEHERVKKCLLDCACSSPAVNQAATALLLQMEISPGFPSILLEILFTEDDELLRFLSCTMCRNVVTRHWKQLGGGGGGGGRGGGTASYIIQDAEKALIKSYLTRFLKNFTLFKNDLQWRQLKCFTLLLRQVARYDFPEQWPELLEALLSLLSSNLTPYLQNSGLTEGKDEYFDEIPRQTLFIVYKLLKEQCSKRLPKDQKISQSIGSHFFNVFGPIWMFFYENHYELKIREHYSSESSFNLLNDSIFFQISKYMDSIFLLLLSFYTDSAGVLQYKDGIRCLFLKLMNLLLLFERDSSFICNEYAVQLLTSSLKLWSELIDQKSSVLEFTEQQSFFDSCRKALELRLSNADNTTTIKIVTPVLTLLTTILRKCTYPPGIASTSFAYSTSLEGCDTPDRRLMSLQSPSIDATRPSKAAFEGYAHTISAAESLLLNDTLANSSIGSRSVSLSQERNSPLALSEGGGVCVGPLIRSNSPVYVHGQTPPPPSSKVQSNPAANEIFNSPSCLNAYEVSADATEAVRFSDVHSRSPQDGVSSRVHLHGLIVYLSSGEVMAKLCETVLRCTIQLDESQFESWVEIINESAEKESLGNQSIWKNVSTLIEELHQEPFSKIVISYIMMELPQSVKMCKEEASVATYTRCDALLKWTWIILKSTFNADALFSSLTSIILELVTSPIHPLLMYRSGCLIKKSLKYGTVPIFEAPNVFEILIALFKLDLVGARILSVRATALLYGRFPEESFWQNYQSVELILLCASQTLFMVSSTDTCCEILSLIVNLLHEQLPSKQFIEGLFDETRTLPHMQSMWNLNHEALRVDMLRLLNFLFEDDQIGSSEAASSVKTKGLYTFSFWVIKDFFFNHSAADGWINVEYTEASHRGATNGLQPSSSVLKKMIVLVTRVLRTAPLPDDAYAGATDNFPFAEFIELCSNLPPLLRKLWGKFFQASRPNHVVNRTAELALEACGLLVCLPSAEFYTHYGGSFSSSTILLANGREFEGKIGSLLRLSCQGALSEEVGSSSVSWRPPSSFLSDPALQFCNIGTSAFWKDQACWTRQGCFNILLLSLFFGVTNLEDEGFFVKNILLPTLHLLIQLGRFYSAYEEGREDLQKYEDVRKYTPQHLIPLIACWIFNFRENFLSQLNKLEGSDESFKFLMIFETFFIIFRRMGDSFLQNLIFFCEIYLLSTSLKSFAISSESFEKLVIQLIRQLDVILMQNTASSTPQNRQSDALFHGLTTLSSSNSSRAGLEGLLPASTHNNKSGGFFTFSSERGELFASKWLPASQRLHAPLLRAVSIQSCFPAQLMNGAPRMTDSRSFATFLLASFFREVVGSMASEQATRFLKFICENSECLARLLVID